ncbi:676_t:CDS:2, partial [Cetraspora pellucida]
GELLRDLQQEYLISGSGIQSSVKTRWSTAWDCLTSILRLQPLETKYIEFRKTCIQIYNRRWDEFDFEIFKLGYFFHPKYRGAGLQIGGFQIIAKAAINIWKSLGGGNKSAETLLTQMKNYREFIKPYDHWDDKTDTLINWWQCCDDRPNYLSQLALKVLAITPHNAGCERIFSVLRWFYGQR